MRFGSCFIGGSIVYRICRDAPVGGMIGGYCEDSVLESKVEEVTKDLFWFWEN